MEAVYKERKRMMECFWYILASVLAWGGTGFMGSAAMIGVSALVGNGLHACHGGYAMVSMPAVRAGRGRSRGVH